MIDKSAKRIAYLLPCGAANAVSRSDLLRLTGLNDRALRAEIERERLAGSIILSSTDGSGGYYLPGSRAELERYIAAQRHRAAAISASLQSAENVLLNWPGDGGD